MREERLSLITPERPSTAPATLVGRDYTLMAADEVLATASLQVVGMPGTGVTAVLDSLAHRRVAAGHTVLRVPASPWSTTSASSEVDALLPHLDAPTVVVDDAQLWPRDELVELLSAVTMRGGRLVLGVHPGDLLDLDVVHLSGLGRDDVRRLLATALGRELEPSDELLVAALARATRGHVSHLLALLEPATLDPLAELAAREDDLDHLREPFADALADSVQAALSTLDESARLAVAVVSLAGPYAPSGLIDSAAGTRQLIDARESGLVERVDGRHRFRHAAVRDLVRRHAPERVLSEARWRLAVGSQATGITTAPRGVLTG